ncbi:(2Fe-2S)-binding protein [Sedimentibacter hydroxybenzoicus DSM 7310]|uniref:(2Fe-2S)-binding protein n=1 Tax=Sedimentibacter hydroxybenzoicus DSM 7310 TaxID=1123245 RepID=A0A974GXN9_SEDHY|nr:[FeFe] hydrogenase, group A [Sedimentibacter hydroxybenzoicus]NYB75804.1 (2Fe-2S)-binding protein [Sedimentibacter hydroxybenzoicus DSM 7310]
MSGIMIIDGMKVQFNNQKNILSLIRDSGIDLPTFCYHSELSIYGACRMCSVETSKGEIIATCSEKPRDGLEIYTNSPRIRKYRKMILELLLANHDKDCTSCERTGKCQLQKLAKRYGLGVNRFTQLAQDNEVDDSSPSIIRNPNKCIKCGDCVMVCEEVQGVGALGFVNRGSEVIIKPAFNKSLAETNCINCGQCRMVCPTGAIIIKNETEKLWDALYDKSKRVIAQIAPAVRVALGEEFGKKPGEVTTGKIVAILKKLGVEEVFDTSLSADLTVVEESNEFLKRYNKGENLPLFTSCCPGWVKFAETRYPELKENISSCKSPQQMFGTVLREAYKEKDAEDLRDTYILSIMPCTAKKAEAARPEFSHDGVREVDLVLTTQELSIMIKEIGIKFDEVEEEAMDMPFGTGSGAGVIFGTTGGVTEAVLRRVLKNKFDKEDCNIIFNSVRGLDSVKEAIVNIDGNEIKIAVVHGLKHADNLIKQIKSGEKKYDLIEVMACNGGCVAGGGQPQPKMITRETRALRSKGLYDIDKTNQLKDAEDNYIVKNIYNGLLKNKTHILHTNH